MRNRLLFLFLVALRSLPAADGGESYRAEIERWRTALEQKLFSDLRLMLIGRFELHEGKYNFGSASSNHLVLPAGPPMLGTIELKERAVYVELRPGLTGTYNNQAITKATLPVGQGNAPSNPLWVGPVGLSVRERNGQIQLLCFDKQAEFVRTRKAFRWFPARQQYRISARFVPFDNPTSLSLPDSDAGQREYPSPGYVSFSIDGQAVTLQPVQSAEGLFFVFRDATSGKQTYGAGRFLNTDLPKNGIVILDFNKATNPLCAYNAFVVCPMPPKQNRLAAAIPAGELNYASH
jgi:uncharacterized protein (DUF1684 family)